MQRRADGGNGNDTLNGGNGNDVLNGQAGADTISAGNGTDAIVFNTALGGGNIDTVTGFSPIDDTFRLDDAIFTALAPGVLPVDAFHIGAAAADATDRIIYDLHYRRAFLRCGRHGRYRADPVRCAGHRTGADQRGFPGGVGEKRRRRIRRRAGLEGHLQIGKRGQGRATPFRASHSCVSTDKM